MTEAWTGPQVAWTMARGGAGAFGGKTINGVWLWLTFCALFFVGLADLRRPLSLRNLDLLALLSFSISLRFFNEGEIFWSAPLAYPPLAYLLGRCLWIAKRDRPPRTSAPVWPVWLLAAACVFLAGFRVGLNVEAQRSVIDVGFAGVVGAQRIANGEMPYGHMPVQEDLKPCGTADAEGEIRERIQTNGRCEASNPRGDTYGPVSYLAYLPGYAVFGWSGKWDELWAAHATSLLFDGALHPRARARRAALRRPAPRGDARVRLGGVPVHALRVELEHERRDHARLPDLGLLARLLGLGARSRGRARGLDEVRRAPAGAALALVSERPARCPCAASRSASPARRSPRSSSSCSSPSRCTRRASSPSARSASSSTATRPSRSGAGGSTTPRGVPDLHVVQQVLQVLVVAGAVLTAFVPRRKSILQLAALTAAVLIGFELVLTHWFYLYIPWFFPFVAFALLYRRDRAAPVH